MRFRNVVMAGLFATTAALSGCSSTDEGTAAKTNTITVTPSLGLVTNAIVRIYQSDSTTLLETSDTGADGVVEISYSGSYTGPLIIVVSGDSDAQYFDEATGSMIAFGGGRPLRAIVPSGTTQVAVTSLTETAYQISLVNGISLTDTVVNQLNERVRQALAPELSSILIPPTIFDSATTTASLDTTEAGKYALRLASLAQLGSANATPALTMAEQLAWDLADGTVDGLHSATPITGLVYNGASFVTDLQAQLSAMANDYGNTALQTSVNSYSTISASVDFSDLIPSSGALPDGVSGQVVTLEYGSTAAGSLYSNAEQVKFTFNSDGTLMLTDDLNVVASSFTVRGSEYIWVDSANSQEYALSLLDGAIHEVNLYGIGGTPFYGQFAIPASTGGGDTTPLTPDGDGAALAGGNGATGTIGTTTYTYSGHPVVGSALYVFAPLTSTGLFTAYDDSSAITRWTISGFPATAAGTYNCDTDSGTPSILLTLNGIPYLADQCTIEIISVSTTEVEGRFAAHIQDGSFNEFGTVTDGYFRYTVPPTGGGSGLADGEFGYSMDVDGENITVTGVPALDGWDRQVSGYLTLGDTPTFQIRMIPDGGVGNYICGQGPAFREVGMTYGGSTSENATGSCAIEVTSAGSVYEGTFSGTLYSSGGTPMAITNGFFRNDGSQL